MRCPKCDHQFSPAEQDRPVDTTAPRRLRPNYGPQVEVKMRRANVVFGLSAEVNETYPKQEDRR